MKWVLCCYILRLITVKLHGFYIIFSTRFIKLRSDLYKIVKYKELSVKEWSFVFHLISDKCNKVNSYSYIDIHNLKL